MDLLFPSSEKLIELEYLITWVPSSVIPGREDSGDQMIMYNTLDFKATSEIVKNHPFSTIIYIIYHTKMPQLFYFTGPFIKYQNHWTFNIDL